MRSKADEVEIPPCFKISQSPRVRQNHRDDGRCSCLIEGFRIHNWVD
ncbi:unnamed protein product [Rhodiola kirilowii]